MPESLPLLLIAERDSIMRSLEKRILKDHFRIIFADSGEDLLRKIHRYNPDAVVIELMLPIMDGFQVCNRIKNDPKTRDIPVVVFTMLLAQERALKAGADAFLMKPLQKDVFMRTVMSLIHGKKS